METTVRQLSRTRRREDAEQRALMEWLQLQHPEAFEHTCHPPNGGGRSKAEAGAFKALGVKPGVPDVLCFLRRGGSVGLALELKRQGAPPSAVSRDQEKWLARLRDNGWSVAVARGFDEARAQFEAYLQERKP
jgi:hypothetical protein